MRAVVVRVTRRQCQPERGGLTGKTARHCRHRAYWNGCTPPCRRSRARHTPGPGPVRPDRARRDRFGPYRGGHRIPFRLPLAPARRYQRHGFVQRAFRGGRSCSACLALAGFGTLGPDRCDPPARRSPVVPLGEWIRDRPIPDRPWLILGKGPSFARRTGVDVGPYNLLSLNHVVREMKVDVAHFIDLDAIEACADVLPRNADWLLVLATRTSSFNQRTRPWTSLPPRPGASGLRSRRRLVWYYHDLRTRPDLKNRYPRTHGQLFRWTPSVRWQPSTSWLPSGSRPSVPWASTAGCTTAGRSTTSTARRAWPTGCRVSTAVLLDPPDGEGARHGLRHATRTGPRLRRYRRDPDGRDPGPRVVHSPVRDAAGRGRAHAEPSCPDAKDPANRPRTDSRSPGS